MRNVVVWVDQRCYLRGGITVIVDLRKPLGCVQLGAGCGWKWGIPQGKLLHSYWTWPIYDGDLPKMVILHRFLYVYHKYTPKKHPFKLENDHKPLDFEVPSQTNPYIWESKQQSLWSASKCWENWLANVGILDFPTKQNNPSGSKYLRRKYDWGMIWGVKYPLRQYLDP